MHRLIKTAVASSNAQTLTPTYGFLKSAEQGIEQEINPVQEAKTVNFKPLRGGINLTHIPAHQSDKNESTPEEKSKKEKSGDWQPFGRQRELIQETPQTEPDIDISTEQPAPPLLTDDTITQLKEGQMRKTAFLEFLKAEITRLIEPVLAGVGQTVEGCPYLKYWMNLYHQKEAAHIEQTIRRYAPDSIGARSASDYVSAIGQRALRAAELWAKTGRLSNIPEDIPTTLPGQALLQNNTGKKLLAKAKSGGARHSEDNTYIQHELGEGQPLAQDVRSRMENAFGVSFAHVRSHTDATAGSFASRVNARAFTVGNHIVFGTGEYKPRTLLGDALIAHELAHTLQQKEWGVEINKMETESIPYNALEKDADQAAEKAVTSLWSRDAGLKKLGQRTIPYLRSGLRLQRCSGSQTPARATVPPVPRVADTCPTSVELESSINMTPGGLDLGYRTGYGIATIMHLLPDSTDWSAAQVFERVTLANTTCPAAWDMCTGGPNPFPINQPKYSTVLGELPARRNRFYDFHTSRWNRSRLHDSGQNPTGMDACIVACNQSYVCNDRVLGRFLITRNFRKAMRDGREITEVNTTKAPA